MPTKDTAVGDLQRIKPIFAEALAKDGPQRQAYLDRACGSDTDLRRELESLLRAHDGSGGFLQAPALAADIGFEETGPAEQPGMVVGRYKLLERIGEGGMAVVYMAEQGCPIRRKVALKIIKLGMDTKQVIARFEAERQALALMDHPNIAKVFEAGATETGRPFFVMELVTGLCDTEYCDQNSLNARERLELFAQICHAVQHAHQKGIIHRDIKPSNVLVARQDGQAVPKVIDFGIAKATNQRLTEKTLFTRDAQIIGTPAYMSPEQAEFGDSDTDTRTDIYSLGVLLYEMLTGTTPFSKEDLRHAGYLEMQRVIRDKEPTKPSTRLSTLGDTLSTVAKQRRATPGQLTKTLRGDLDWIVMKSLEKDRARRYTDVSTLQEDIQRHLNHEPVSAGPPSTWYRMKKFVQRHRALVAATVAVVIAVVTGLVLSITMYVQAERARLETRNVSDFLRNDLLATVRPENMRGQEATVRYILENASANLEGKSVGSPLVDAEIRTTLGLTYQKMGDYVAAEPHLEQALETRRRVLGEAHPDTLQSMCDLAWQHLFQGRFDAAEAPALQALETGRRALGREHPVVLSAMECCGFMYVVGFQTRKAEPILHEGYETSHRVLGEEHEKTIFFMNQLAWLYDAQHRQDAAVEAAVRAFDVARTVLGQEHPHTIQAMNQLGRAYTVEGRFDEAETLLRESVELSRRVLGEGHLFTLFYAARLASVYRAQGQFEKMEDITAEALQIAQGIPGKLMVTWYLRFRLRQRTVALSADTRERYDAGEYGEAVELLTRHEKLRQSLDYGYTELPPPDVALLAMSFHHLERDEEAQDTLHRLREMLEEGEYIYEEQYLYEAERLFAGDEDLLSGEWNLLEEGKLEDVSRILEHLQAPAPQDVRGGPGSIQNLVKALARAYRVRGSRAEGCARYQEAMSDYEAALRTNPGCASAHARLARLFAVCHLAEVRDGVRSVEHATTACELTEWKNHFFISTLAAAHAEAGDFSTAVQCQNQAIDLLGEEERGKWLPGHEMRLRLYEAGRPYRWSLVGWWTFDKCDGKVVLDSSGNDLHGQLVGDAHVIEDANRSGSVLCLDGDGDWVDCGNDAMLHIVSEITVACWMKAERFDKQYQTVIGNGGEAWWLGRDVVSDRLAFGCSGVVVPDNMNGAVTGRTNVNDARWHHVAGVYDGTAVRLYVDGVLDVSSEASGNINTNSYMVLIGEDDKARSGGGQDHSFKGFLDDVRIYNYALTKAEIVSLYAGQESREREG